MVLSKRSSKSPAIVGDLQSSVPEDNSGSANKCDDYALEKRTWAERYTSGWLLPYIQLSRMNRPAGNFLVLWPCFWGVAYAAPAHSAPDVYLLALFTIMSLIIRSGGCVVNDMWDKDFDKRVERTNCRPLASGAISLAQAGVFFALHFVLGFANFYPLNKLTGQLALVWVVLIVLYPVMKRITYWPQAWLGFTINFGIVLGWTAIHENQDWHLVAPLYCASVFWTIIYDTLYAHQDKNDDARIGVKSTALLFGNKTIFILNFFSIITVVSLVVAGNVAFMSHWYYIGVVGCAMHLVWQVNTADLNDPLNLQKRFKSNIWFGAIMFVSIVAGKALR